ncbi:UNVERIFIED_CONTAM: hypothetical protein HDU68_002384 [Siphonaria sp. JEL0065]|nr:hypothetical protein HDU68_002384 [Siphonaria sp. JEL0065]
MAAAYNPNDSFPPLSNDQLSHYFTRIKVHEPISNLKPTLQTLNLILDAHSKTIPFENCPTFFTKCDIPIDLESLVSKLVDGNRGGYCFENNILLLSVLLALGFHTSSGVARSAKWNTDLKKQIYGGTTHMIVFVDLGEEGLHLADLGYNYIGLTRAIRIAEGETVESAAGEMHQMRSANVTGPGNWMLHHKRAVGSPLADGVDSEGDLFGPHYYFTLERFRPQDYVGYNFFVSQSPTFVLQTSLMVSMVSETGGRVMITDKTFKRRESAVFRHLECITKLENVEMLVHILQTVFGIELSEREKERAHTHAFFN